MLRKIIRLVPKLRIKQLRRSSSTSPLNIREYIESIKGQLVPPVGNKMIYSDKLQVMVVGGPNRREDFHIEEGEELFIQLKGCMNLNILEHGSLKVVKINEGETFLLPKRVPHSPQRFADTIGLVVERKRMPSEKDGLIWYVPDQIPSILYEEYFHCTDLGMQLKPIIERFFASPEYLEKKPSQSIIISPIQADNEVSTSAARKLLSIPDPMNSSSTSSYPWCLDRELLATLSSLSESSSVSKVNQNLIIKCK